MTIKVTVKRQCEGWRTHGGAFSFGPVNWEQCKHEAIVVLTVIQEKTEEMPACLTCWQEAIDNKIKISAVIPLRRIE